MAWSQRFLDMLARRDAQPIFVCEGYRWGVYTIQPQWRISSQPVEGALKSAQIVLEGSSVTGSELNPRDATCQLSSFTVAFRGSPRELFMFGARRGQFVALKMGFPGDPIAAFERIEIGVLADIQGGAGTYAIVVHDFGKYAANRKTSTASNLKLFDSVASTTTLSSGYSVGDTTLNVGSTAAFSRQDDGSGTLKGVIRVEHSTPFYLTYTGKTGATFTGCSTTGQLGTTAAAVSSGTTITECAYMDDHPIDAMRRVLVSTGTAGTNGTYDWLPLTWGLGIPGGFVDNNDSDYYRSKTQPASGADDWDILVEDEQDDGLAWLQNTFSPGGFFLCPHQGSISCRAVLNPRAENTMHTLGWPIDDRYIVGSEVTSEAWSANDQIEYPEFIVASASGSSSKTATLSTWPAAASYTRDLSAQVNSNQSAIRVEVRERLGPWFLRVPEILRFPLLGRHWAALSPGDVVRVTSRLLTGRERTTEHGFSGQRALVLGRSPRWFGEPVTDMVIAMITDSSGAGP